MAQIFDLKQASVTELKALAFDLNVLITRTQQNLKIVMQELESRSETISQETTAPQQA